MGRTFSLVDVFGVEDFSGNPLAVVHDAEGIDTDEMLRITRWL
ncbi:MAG TPA: phenazine biosynthesis protein PhzF, partial [Chloroflexota bacterium]|nr:phenazine biosynthesis protein PhzF [Chloroflexota bacterium]